MPKKNDSVILLTHGDGGIKTSELISGLIKKHLGNHILDKLEDSAIFSCPPDKKIAFTTDSFVINPLFFPGGDIGKLCVCGTINDLVTTGCVPASLSLSFILEEGFPINDFERIILSIKETLKSAGGRVEIVTGDTKVVEKGNADKIYINTAGIGFIEKDINIGPPGIKKDDAIIIN
ncbi:MAG: hydrogenase expression/formation protein HypE, partial [Actinobacteria bacterium]|nr:hydrogenase expression/formation protein HypE [Actinomycetota bacterium]